MANKIPCASPLQWPASKPRTIDKRDGNYGHSGRGYQNRNVTLAESRNRVFREIAAFTGNARYWVIAPDECLLTTNMETNLDGTMRARQRKPEDQGAALVMPWNGRKTVIAVDCFYTLEQNIAGIASALEAVRRLHRLDASMMDQAMSGFQALPPPDVVAGRSWRSVLGFKETDRPTFEEAKRSYRICASAAHPDKGGQPGVAADVNRAWEECKLELAPVYSHSA